MLPSRLALSSVLAAVLPCSLAFAQDFGSFFPEARYDPAIPTLEQVVGHGWGEKMSSHAETQRYLQALADASPLLTLQRYGEAWSGKALQYLVLSDGAYRGKLDEIRSGMAKLADPRTLADGEADTLIRDLPAVTWLSFSVHGDEVSCTDAGLFLAYHLAAAQADPTVDAIRKDSVVILDPLVNPDGRDRFVHHFRDNVGRFPDASPSAAEHDQDWPGGRFNHYLFDLNRDWFARTQPETQARVREFLRWHPVVYVDAHEMGANSTFYFAPPSEPVHPEITQSQRDWLTRYGKNNARWFDRFGIDYFTREDFDAFYPGYGDCWPLMNGSIGMTYEQASPRGLVMRRNDESELTYRDAVSHHAIATLATAETAALGREDALRAFLDYRESAIREGQEGDGPREYVFPIREGHDQERIRRLLRGLQAQGVEIRQAKGALTNQAARDLDEPQGKATTQDFPAGSYLVSLAQPQKRLAHTLLARHFDMTAAFVEEQTQNEARRERTAFYDLTGWSLPLLFDVEAWVCDAASQGNTDVLDTISTPDRQPLAHQPSATIAYLVDAKGTHSLRLLSGLLRREVKVRCADKPFTIQGRTYAPGSLVIPVAGNIDDVHQIVRDEMEKAAIQVRTTDSSWVDDGIHFGSNQMAQLKTPRIALAWGSPTSPVSAGCMRWMLEHEYGCPVTPIATGRLASRELDRFNVLILPSGGGFGREIGKSGAARIRRWIQEGGTLITLGGATSWLTGDDVGLLATEAERRQGGDKAGGKGGGKGKSTKQAETSETDSGDDAKEEVSKEGDSEADGSKDGGDSDAFDYQKAIQPEDEAPARTPGAILRATVDPRHWLAFGGQAEETFVVANSSRIYTPVKLDRGTNVIVYGPRDRLLVSGFTWPHALDQLPGKAYLVHQPVGRGHVVAFAEDPTLRGITEGLQRFLLNAVLLGPGH